MFEEQINLFDKNMEERIKQFDQILTAKIDRLEKIINGLRVTNTTVFDTPEVKPAQPP